MTSVRPNLAMDDELKRKILFTLLALVIYRVGAHIAAPGVNVGALADFILNSAAAGFFGSRPFSRANELLVRAGGEPVDWSLHEPVMANQGGLERQRSVEIGD